MNYLQGEILRSLEQPENVVPFLKKSVELDPGYLKAHAALARSYVRLGNQHEALPHLEKALPVDTDGSLHYLLARAYGSARKRELVRGILKKHREPRQAAVAAQRKVSR